MKYLLFMPVICIALSVRSQGDSTHLRVMRQIRSADSLTKATVSYIDKSSSYRFFIDTILRCGDGCENKSYTYYTYTYDLDNKLVKVKVSEAQSETIKEYYYSKEKMILVKFRNLQILNGAEKMKVNGRRNFHMDYSTLDRYASYNNPTVEHMQFLLDGYKFLVRFYEIFSKKG